MCLFKPITESSAIGLWNKFVNQYQGITPFSFNPSLFYFYKNHFNWKPYYFLIYQNQKLYAILPLVNTRKAWVSLPHFSYGGILSHENIETFNIDNIINCLIEEEEKHTLKSGFYQLNIEEILNNKFTNSQKFFLRSLENQRTYNFHKTIKVSSILKLPSNGKIFFENINSNLKRKIRKSIKSQVTIKDGGIELLNDFHKVYSRNIYALKSLNYSKKTLSDLFLNYKFGDLKIFVAYKDCQAVGVSMMASYNGFYENMFFATKTEVRKYYVSDLLHYEMINYCINANKNTITPSKSNAVYSFGRSTINSGVHKYKNHWPVNDYPIYVHSNMGDIRKHNWIANIWALLPFFISKPLGAKLIKHIY